MGIMRKKLYRAGQHALSEGFQHVTPYGLRLSASQLFLDAPRDQSLRETL